MQACKYIAAIAASTVLTGAGVAGMVMPAQAASTSTAHATVASCFHWHNISHVKSGGDVVELQYDPVCRVARAHLTRRDHAHPNVGWGILVFNRNTKKIATVDNPHTITGVIGEPRHTFSHACVVEGNGEWHCTPYF